MTSIILSSIPLKMCSSVSPSLLLFLSTVFFISVIVFSSDFFFSSLLKFSLFSSVIFPSLISVLISYTLNSSVNYLPVSLVVFFFRGFCLVLSFEANSSVLLFCSLFSVSVKLGETVTYCSLVGVSGLGHP